MIGQTRRLASGLTAAALLTLHSSCSSGGSSAEPTPQEPQILSVDGSAVVTPGQVEEYSVRHNREAVTCSGTDLSAAGSLDRVSAVSRNSVFNYIVAANSQAVGTTATLKFRCEGLAGTTAAETTKAVSLAHTPLAEFVDSVNPHTLQLSVVTPLVLHTEYAKSCGFPEYSPLLPFTLRGIPIGAVARCDSVWLEAVTMPIGSRVSGTGRYQAQLAITVLGEDPRYPARANKTLEFVAGNPALEHISVDTLFCPQRSNQFHVRSDRPIFSFGNGAEYRGTTLEFVFPITGPAGPQVPFLASTKDAYLLLGGCGGSPGVFPYTLFVENPGDGGGQAGIPAMMIFESPGPAPSQLEGRPTTERPWVSFIRADGRRLRISPELQR